MTIGKNCKTATREGRFHQLCKEKGLYVEQDTDEEEIWCLEGHAGYSYNIAKLVENTESSDQIDEQMGFFIKDCGVSGKGLLLDIRESCIKDEWSRVVSCLDFYLMGSDGKRFKVRKHFPHYLLLKCNNISEIEEFIRGKFGKAISCFDIVKKTDLFASYGPNTKKQPFLKLEFKNSMDFHTVKKYLAKIIGNNKHESSWCPDIQCNDVLNVADRDYDSTSVNAKYYHCERSIIDIHEHDIPYISRVCIDTGIRIGKWYRIYSENGKNEIQETPQDTNVDVDHVVMVLDIKTTCGRSGFRDPKTDCIIMLSCLVDGKGFLIVNNEAISTTIRDFEYNPVEEIQCDFHVFNEKDEKGLLLRLFSRIQSLRPNSILTYDGDNFVFVFLECRSQLLGLNIRDFMGFSRTEGDMFVSSYAIHIDVLKLVQRDQKLLNLMSTKLSGICKSIFGFIPVLVEDDEIDYYLSENPQFLASNFVASSAVVYSFYKRCLHKFLLELCLFVPLTINDIVRADCTFINECIIMSECAKMDILVPNRSYDAIETTYEGHVIKDVKFLSENARTFEFGVFHEDMQASFQMKDVHIVNNIIESLASIIKFNSNKDFGPEYQRIINLNDIMIEVNAKINDMLEKKNFKNNPTIYHLNVESLYEGIMVANNIQPFSITTKLVCPFCGHNVSENEFHHKVDCTARLEYFPATQKEINTIKNQLEHENTFKQEKVSFYDLGDRDRILLLKRKLSQYCKTNYKHATETKVVKKEFFICGRQHSFYVDIIRKLKHILRGRKLRNNENASARLNAVKLILNSFYHGMVKKGSRWYSSEMVGVLNSMVSPIRPSAKSIIESLGGRVLESDVSEILFILPATFPSDITVKLGGPFGQVETKNIVLIQWILNYFLYKDFGNPCGIHKNTDSSEHGLNDENYIEFDIKGRYKGIFIPYDSKGGHIVKNNVILTHKNVVVFQRVEERETQFIQLYSCEIGDHLFRYKSYHETYSRLCDLTLEWIRQFKDRVVKFNEHELVVLFEKVEVLNNTANGEKNRELLTKILELDGKSIGKSSKISCRFLVSRYPTETGLKERKIPTRVFGVDASLRKKYTFKWLGAMCNDIKDILDWNHYFDVFQNKILEFVVVPSVWQGIENPKLLNIISCPEWVYQNRKQNNILDLRSVLNSENNDGKSHERTKQIDINQIFIGKDLVNSQSKKSSKLKRKTPVRISDRSKIEQNANRPASASKCNMDVRDLIRNKKWNILCVREIKSGELKLWIYVENHNIFCIVVTVPHRCYVNMYIEDLPDGLEGTRVYKTLPNGKVSFFLYEVKLDGVSDERIRKLGSLGSIEGIYENDTNNILSSFEYLGAVCRFNQQSSNTLQTYTEDGNTILEISDCAKNDFTDSYLSLSSTSDSHSRPRFLFVNFVAVGSDRVLVVVINQHLNSIKIFVTDSNARINEKICRDEYTKAMNVANANARVIEIGQEGNLNINIESFNKVEFLLEELDRYFDDGDKNSLMILRFSGKSHVGAAFSVRLGFLNKFPILPLPADGKMGGIELLDWQRNHVIESFSFFLHHLDSWLCKQILLSQLSNIPICNLVPSQYTSQNGINVLMGLEDMESLQVYERFQIYNVLDVMFFRHLRENNYLSLSVHDNGVRGRYEDLLSSDTSDRLSLLQSKANLRDGDMYRSDHQNHGGYYDGYCFELRLSGFSTNSLLEYDNLCAQGAESELRVKSDNRAAYVSVFRNRLDYILNRNSSVLTDKYVQDLVVLLNRLFAKLTKDFKTSMSDIQLYDRKHGLIEAIYLVFELWLTDRNSKSYNIHIHRKINYLTYSSIHRTMECMEKIGFRVVNSNITGRFVVATNRRDIDNIDLHIDYLQQEINSIPGLSYISIDFVNAFSRLLWIDPFNYCGEIPNTHGGVKRFQRWRCTRHFPHDARKDFYTTVENILEVVSTVSDETRDICDHNQILRGILGALDRINSSLDVDTGTRVSVLFARHLYHLARHLSRYFDPEFPINIISFVGKSEWDINSCNGMSGSNRIESLMVYDVICNNCLSYRDVDVSNEQNTCDLCSSVISHETITENALQQIKDVLIYYKRQDKFCDLCHGEAERALQCICACGGNFTYKIANTWIKDYLRLCSQMLHQGDTFSNEFLSYCFLDKS